MHAYTLLCYTLVLCHGVTDKGTSLLYAFPAPRGHRPSGQPEEIIIVSPNAEHGVFIFYFHNHFLLYFFYSIPYFARMITRVHDITSCTFTIISWPFVCTRNDDARFQLTYGHPSRCCRGWKRTCGIGARGRRVRGGGGRRAKTLGCPDPEN